MSSQPSFVDLFGRPPAIHAEAPGRVNLIGEHTDYNGGFVLPTVIPQRTVVDLVLRDDRRVRAWSANVDAAHQMMEFVLGDEARTRTWLDYVQGVMVALRNRGHRLTGADIRIESAVPSGLRMSRASSRTVGGRGFLPISRSKRWGTKRRCAVGS